MTTALATKLEAPAPNRGLSIPGLWWQPCRVAYHDRQSWRTVPWHKFNPKNPKMQTLAISPIGTDGLCRFVAWDIDHGGPETVRKLLAALPQGCVPLVSKSGGRNGQGFHVWIFLSRPLPVQTCVSFAKAVLLQSGVRCEVFPTGPNSLCLKWPGQKHPETGKQEVFVHKDDLTTKYDTEAVLQMLAEGYYHTPAAVVADYARRHGRAARGKVSKFDTQSDTTVSKIDTQVDTQAGHPDASQGKAKPMQSLDELGETFPQIGETFPQIGGIKLVGTLDELAKREELARELMRLVGRRPVPLGKAFRCILPGHEERHPSATWVRLESGHIMYHDWHQKDGEEWYTMQEVFHAIATSKVKKLSRLEAARWLAGLGIRSGFATELVLRQREKAKAAAVVLASLQQGQQAAGTQQDAPTPSCDSPCQTRGHYLNGCSPKGDWLVVLKVWEAVAEEAEIQAMGGFEEISLSARFLARRAKVKVEQANKAVNLLCCLGLLEKVPGSGGMKGDRFKLCGEADAEEAKRRLEALFPDGQVDLRAFKRELVAARLGPELAATVFRRGAETLVAASVEICNQSCNQSGENMPPLHLPEAAKGNPFIAAIRQAEAAGDWDRADALLRGLVAWLAAGRPEVAAYFAGASP